MKKNFNAIVTLEVGSQDPSWRRRGRTEEVATEKK